MAIFAGKILKMIFSSAGIGPLSDDWGDIGAIRTELPTLYRNG
jgi:hypothetical protein